MKPRFTATSLEVAENCGGNDRDFDQAKEKVEMINAFGQNISNVLKSGVQAKLRSSGSDLDVTPGPVLMSYLVLIVQ